MTRYAFWNGGAIRPLRSNKNVKLSDERTILALTAPRPDDDIYELVDEAEPKGSFQKTGAAYVERDGWRIVRVTPAEWLPPARIADTLVDAANTQAGGVLAETDWMRHREFDEPDKPVPIDVVDYRSAVRQAVNDFEAAIDAVLLGSSSDNDKSETLSVMTPVWPEPDDYDLYDDVAA